MALHLLHASPAAAIAFYDPRLGAVGKMAEVTNPNILSGESAFKGISS